MRIQVKKIGVIGEEYGLEFRIVKNEEWITPMYLLSMSINHSLTLLMCMVIGT